MLRHAAVRLISSVAVLLLVTIGLFTLSHLAPGGPLGALIPLESLAGSEDLIAAKSKEFGLDQPAHVQYFTWLGRVLHGDLGMSFQHNRPVADLLLERVGPTLELMGTGLVIGNLIAVVLGVFTASRKNSATDYAISGMSLTVLSVPPFFLGMVGIYLLSARLRVLPSAGMSSPGDGSVRDLLVHLIMPASVLALVQGAAMMRYVRAGMLEELSKDYVRTVIAKGASPLKARLKALRNGLLPLITLLMMSISGLLGGAVVLESVFAWPGMGQLTLAAIQFRDYPLILGFGLVVAIVVIVSNFLADLLLVVADPRVRLR